MNDLVEIQNRQAVTTSLKVAEVFAKDHRHVLESIENIKAENSALTKFFYEGTYKAGTGKAYKMYYMNRDGLTLLAMGFTGKKAMEWKLKYIEAFNQMEKKLQNPQISPNPHYRTRMVKTAVKDIGDTANVIAEVFGVKKPMAMASAMQMVGEAYGVDCEPLRKLLPSEDVPGFMTPTILAKELNVLTSKGKPNPAEVNQLLAAKGLQERIGKEWRLTDLGKQYGEVKPFSNGSHHGYQIQWHEKVLEVLKE